MLVTEELKEREDEVRCTALSWLRIGTSEGLL
jgi:hypothetical protein